MLAELQRNWVSSLYRNGHVPVAGLRGQHAEARFEIYRASLLANLTQALAGTCPVVEKLVGESFFGAAARAYLRAHPSQHGDIHTFGDHFAAFYRASSRLEHCRTWQMLRALSGWRIGHFTRQTGTH